MPCGHALSASLLFVLVASASHAQPATPSDEAAIRTHLTGYIEARSRQDAHAEAMFYADDADFRAADGTWAVGRQQIERALAPSGPPRPDFRFRLAIGTIRFLNPDVAVVDAVASNTGNYATYVMVKRGGMWLIGAARLALAAPSK
jgi:uncharacterized protein (TIGR02246 family)